MAHGCLELLDFGYCYIVFFLWYCRINWNVAWNIALFSLFVIFLNLGSTSSWHNQTWRDNRNFCSSWWILHKGRDCWWIAQNWQCQDTVEKEAVLLIIVTGTHSTKGRSQRIHVRHCCSDEVGQKVPSRRIQSIHQHGSDGKGSKTLSDVTSGFNNISVPWGCTSKPSFIV